MRSRRLLTALLLALAVSGLFTFWLSRRLPRAHAAAAAPVVRRYVVAARELQAGEELRADALTLQTWNGSAEMQGVSTTTAELIGRVVLYPLAANEPILRQQLADMGAGAGLSYRIPQGMRAVSVKSSDILGVSGFLLPGTHVDALVTPREAEAASPRTLPLLENVQVLAAGQKVEPDPQGKAVSVDVITLLVSPAEAERLVSAMAAGDVHFLLRNGSDHSVTTAVPSAAKKGAGNVRGAARGASKSTGQPAAFQVELVNGDKHSTETF